MNTLVLPATTARRGLILAPGPPVFPLEREAYVEKQGDTRQIALCDTIVLLCTLSRPGLDLERPGHE